MMNPVGKSILIYVNNVGHHNHHKPLGVWKSKKTRCKKDNTEGVRPLGSQQDWINSYEDGTVVSWIQGLQVTLWAVDTLVDCWWNGELCYLGYWNILEHNYIVRKPINQWWDLYRGILRDHEYSPHKWDNTTLDILSTLCSGAHFITTCCQSEHCSASCSARHDRIAIVIHRYFSHRSISIWVSRSHAMYLFYFPILRLLLYSML